MLGKYFRALVVNLYLYGLLAKIQKEGHDFYFHGSLTGQFLLF